VSGLCFHDLRGESRAARLSLSGSSTVGPAFEPPPGRGGSGGNLDSKGGCLRCQRGWTKIGRGGPNSSSFADRSFCASGQIVRRSAVVQSRIWKFTASFPEWDANRVVLERQAFYVRWARRPRKERASTVIARVRGELGGGLFICLKIRRGGMEFSEGARGGRAQMVEIERGSENFEGWSGGGACVLIVLASRSASHLFKRHADSLRSLVRHCLLEG
jgi:hypothetical protein